MECFDEGTPQGDRPDRPNSYVLPLSHLQFFVNSCLQNSSSFIFFHIWQIALHLYSFHITSSQIWSVLYTQLFPQNCTKQHCGLSYSSQSMHVSSLISLIISKYSCWQCQGLTECCVLFIFPEKSNASLKFCILPGSKKRWLDVFLNNSGLQHKHPTELSNQVRSVHLVFPDGESYQK